MVSTAGLEPARVSPHAPQTCTYTDSVTSTYLDYCIQLSNFVLVFVTEVVSWKQPSRKTILNRFSRQSVTSTYLDYCIQLSNFVLVFVTEVVSWKQPSRKTIHYVISWSLALNGSAVICFINCIYSANKPSPSARSRSAECHSTIKLSISSTA